MLKGHSSGLTLSGLTEHQLLRFCIHYFCFAGTLADIIETVNVESPEI